MLNQNAKQIQTQSDDETGRLVKNGLHNHVFPYLKKNESRSIEAQIDHLLREPLSEEEKIVCCGQYPGHWMEKTHRPQNQVGTGVNFC